MDIKKEAVKLHRDNKGKIATISKVPLKTKKDLALAYTPGVAEVSKLIYENENESYELTNKGNTVAIISDGTAVLGLGDIGPLGALPVMEGKAAIFKEFAGVDAVPIVLNTKDEDEIVEAIKMIAPSFGGINLEDIAAPKCFNIERRLKEELNIPVFHDDQHGTAVVVAAALINALKITGKDLKDIKIVINGAGAAGSAITKFLIYLGALNIIVCDRNGILNAFDDNLSPAKKELVELTKSHNKKGSLADALVGADCFIGVSVGNVVTREMLKKMNKDFICFPLANPVPEIAPELAKKAGAKIVGTGLSNIPNQINNALAFPGLFKGILKERNKQFDYYVLKKASYALANVIKDEELKEDYIIPDVFNPLVVKNVSEAVSKAIKES